jgi:hypothetical protein
LSVYIDSVLTTAWSLTSTFTVRLDSALADEATVRIRRITPIDEPVVDFTGGSVMAESDLDMAFLQIIYAQQELDDFTDLSTLADEVADAAASAAAALASQTAAAASAAAAATAETNAETAETNAELAETNAELAETNAETAQAAAEAALAAALVAQTAAELAETHAETAETNAETAETNAETAQAAAEAARDAALAAKVAAELAETNAETAETNAETAETNAAASAAAAAASAATATMSENPIINPCMEIWQRGNSFVAAASGQFCADRWAYSKSGAMVHTLSQSTDVPTVAQAGLAFNYSILIDCTTADAAVAAGDFAQLTQSIEGFNWRHFAQRALTLSFWVKATKTGTYCVSLTNTGGDRSFVGTYTVSVTDTWEKKTVLISASPSAGTWDYINGTGAILRFALMAGTTYQSTAGWTTGNFLATSAQVNACDDTANNWRVTGVKLELGSTATDLRFRPFDHELSLCQRYYELGQDAMWSGNTTNAVVYYNMNPFRVYKRAAPTMTFTDISNSGFPAGNPTGFSAQQTIAICSKTANATASGAFYRYSWIANAEL